MSKRTQGSAARVGVEIAEGNTAGEQPAPASAMTHSTTGTYNATESTFFTRGDLGVVEPPVYLPRDPILIPLIGVGFLAALTAFVLLL